MVVLNNISMYCLDNVDIRLHYELNYADINSIIKISEDQLGKNYLNQSDINHPSYRWVLATIDGNIIGFSSFFNGNSDATIADVAVDKQFQGNNIATHMIGVCVFELAKLWVDSIECYAWETNGYPHLEKPLIRNGFEKRWTEKRVPDDYRRNFECPVCGCGCQCNSVLFVKKLKHEDIFGYQ